MKTILFVLFFGIFSAGIASNSILSSRYDFTEESYINDIPFNTKAIFGSYIAGKAQSMKLADELPVDDIPFNTSVIAQSVLAPLSTVQTVLDDEKYVDDIPFNTANIAASAKSLSMVLM